MEHEKTKLISEFSQLATELALKKSPYLKNFNGEEWFSRWMNIPNVGLGSRKPVDVMMTEPEAVKEVMGRISITPFSRNYEHLFS